MSKCQTCKTPKWRGDVCTNPDCTKAISPKYRLIERTKRSPITLAVKHGFHEPVFTMKGI